MSSVDLLRRSSYFYELPARLIAQTPSERRDMCRLMTVDRTTGRVGHMLFRDIAGLLRPGDCLVLNDTKVIPARIFGTSSGHTGEVETVLLRRAAGEGELWECLTRPGKKTRPGAVLTYAGGVTGQVTGVLEGGVRLIRFQYEGNFMEKLDEIGMMPLPPYITKRLEDNDSYQTVYAKYAGSAAAPTAGLHFTDELLARIEDSGVDVARVLLHVGIGTFRPVKEDDLTAHKMHSEYIRVTEEAAAIVNRAKARGGRIVAVGTTSCRTLESASDENGVLHPYSGETDIFIYPSYRFKVMDALITNFHLPESTLLMLVSAFGGYDHMMQAYRIAVAEGYRFFSFGDAMFIS